MARSNTYPPFGGYLHRQQRDEDPELTHVAPGTPCGEYMRCFWHPVALSSEATDLPRNVRILGEDLILFRDKRGRVGLVHKQCCHRGASLEYGICEQRGIRCCYHGWLFDVDGSILETPGEPADSKAAESLRANLRQGAYEIVEHNGLIFAYMGHPDHRPAFPYFDTFEIPGTETQPYARDYPCNWLQITENAMDPVHAVFLHVRASGPQFAESWGQLSVKEFYERETGLFYTNARKVDDKVWVRLHEVILPNLTHAGAVMTMDGAQVKYFGRNSFTRWVVPVDNENSRVIAWANFGEKTDPPDPEWRTEEGIDVIEGGMPRDRSAEECQRYPGDYEAFIGQGPITSHAMEHRVSSDRGVELMRRRIKTAVRGLKEGKRPFQPADLAAAPIPTYCGDVVLHCPHVSATEEELAEHSRKVIAIIRAADHLTGRERYDKITEDLKTLEA